MTGDNPFIPGFVSEGNSPDQLIAGRFPLVTAQSIMLTGAAKLARGTVLGMITSSGKYQLSVKTASDGSQNPTAILADTTDASAGDVLCGAYLTGEFNANALIFDSSWTVAQIQAALRAAGIFVRQPVSAAAVTTFN